MEKKEIILDIIRVANELKTSHLSVRQYKIHGKINPGTVENTFGSWNAAVGAAGLEPLQPGPSPELNKQKISDDDLLQEILRLAQELGKRPSSRNMNAMGRYSERPYMKRWGSLEKAYKIACEKFGYPEFTGIKQEDQKGTTSPLPQKAIVPTTIKSPVALSRKKIQFGEPIDFRGLRFAPINEQGVVFIFGMVSREIGFLIESIRTEYPDCEGKRCVDLKNQRWEHVRIEFEYKSSNFKEHGHNPEDCDLIICWIHDYKDCPVEVLELKSQIKHLAN